MQMDDENQIESKKKLKIKSNQNNELEKIINLTKELSTRNIHLVLPTSHVHTIHK